MLKEPIKTRIEEVRTKHCGYYNAIRNLNANSAFTGALTTCRKLDLEPEDHVVDIGAYIGEYSIWSVRQGVTSVVAYEATPSTFEVLQSNCRGCMRAVHAAVVGDDRQTAQLHVSYGIGVANSIAKTGHKLSPIEVPAIRYEDAIKGATVVKIDVEGAEWGFDILGNLKGLRGIVLEFHPVKSCDWKNEAQKIMAGIRDAGFTPITEPALVNCRWDTGGVWVR